jgi:primosomal protein N' (replication factor Y)
MAKNAQLKVSDLEKIMPSSAIRKSINNLIEKNYISVSTTLIEEFKPKKETYVFLNSRFKNEENLHNLMNLLDKKPKQLELFLSYMYLIEKEKFVSVKLLLKESNCTKALLNSLLNADIFYQEVHGIDRINLNSFDKKENIILSKTQEEVYRNIKKNFVESKTTLLKGITGSGKTHIYFKLIEDALVEKKQVFYLLPEIALTVQIIQKLQAHFGDVVGVYHSKFNNNERLEIWQKTMLGEYKIIIGARSALFLPFKNLGLVIIDEEHDGSYIQQDPAPRYHARDAAIFLANKLNANIILGSATPSVESYQNALSGKYNLEELNERFGQAKLPEVIIEDMKNTLGKENSTGIFTENLLIQIDKSLQQKKQVILFQNRRGYSPFQLCSVCGWVPNCHQCDISLTYHKSSDKLHCHYCGTVYKTIQHCMACGHHKMISKSFGTERIEEEIEKIFPQAKVERFDWDVMKTKNKFTETIKKFEDKQIDILVGTQMLVKGLDFSNVNLVGVINADSLLTFPDYKVNEKVYQLLEQVSGRAGRKDENSQVIIQTYRASHPVIKFVQQHATKEFLEQELNERKIFNYPPFSSLIKITLKHKNEAKLDNVAHLFYQEIIKLDTLQIVGPAKPPVAKIRNYYLQELLIKMKKNATHQQEIKNSLLDIFIKLKNNSTCKGIIIVPHVNV